MSDLMNNIFNSLALFSVLFTFFIMKSKSWNRTKVVIWLGPPSLTIHRTPLSVCSTYVHLGEMDKETPSNSLNMRVLK